MCCRSSALRSVTLAMSVLLAGGCSSGGSSAAPSTPSPTVALSGVMVVCGGSVVYGPASLTAGPYGAGSVAALATPCPAGSPASVTFTPGASSSALGSMPELVFDLMPSAGTSATAVAAGDATSFTAGTPVIDLSFTTSTFAASSFLYVYLTHLEPQGD